MEECVERDLGTWERRRMLRHSSRAPSQHLIPPCPSSTQSFAGDVATLALGAPFHDSLGPFP